MGGALSLTEYLVGVAVGAAILAAVVGGAALAVARRMPQLAGAPRALAVGVASSAGLIAVHVLPAALGVLGLPAVLVASLAFLAAAWRLPARAGRIDGGPRSPASEGAPSLAFAGLGLGLLAAVALAVVTRDRITASTGLDMVNFHLPDVATWIDTGTLWQVVQFVPDLAHGNYPNNGDFVLLAAVLPWESDFLVRVAMVPFFALMVLGSYVAARELRSARTTAALSAAAVASAPIVLESGVRDALPDAVMFAGFACGLAMLLRHHRTREPSDLVLAAVALGIAFGTKWYGVSAFAAVLLVWCTASAAGGRAPGAVARGAGVLCGLALAGGGVWLLRNLVESGNPVFPVDLSPLFDAPRDVAREIQGFTVAGYLGEPGVWRDYLLPTYRDFLALPALFVAGWALLALPPALAAWRRGVIGVAADRRVLALLATAALLAVVYVLLPYSAQGAPGRPVFAGPNTRYVIPALLAAAPVAAWVATRLPRLRLVVELTAVVAILDGLLQAFEIPVGRTVVAGLLLAGGAAAGLVVLRRRVVPGGRVAVALGLVVAAVAAVALGHRDQQAFAEARYRGVDETFDWMLDNAPSDTRVGLAGNWAGGVAPPYPMFGPRLENDVEYVGPWVDGMLRRYEDRAAFAEALRRGDYNLLVVGRGFLAAPGRPPARPVREEVWARRLGLEQVARSDTLTLFRGPG